MTPAASFPWLSPAPRPRRRAPGARAGGESRPAMYVRELAERAGLFYRLGYPQSRAVARLKANVAWDFEVGTRGRPAGLTDKDIGEIVKATYQRRPTR